GVGASRGCKVSFMVRPDELVCPSPSRTFTFELSPPESPHRDVEYHYAGKQPIPRDRTFTGETHSPMGCERMHTNKKSSRVLIQATWNGQTSSSLTGRTWLTQNPVKRCVCAPIGR